MKTFYENIDSNNVKVTYSYKTYPSHFHKSIEVLYVTKGELITNINGNLFTATKNQLIFIESNDIHGVNKSTEYLTLLIPPCFLNDYFKLTNGKCVANKIYTDADLYVYNLIIKILENDVSNNLILSGLINLLLGKIIDGCGLIPARKQLDGLREIFVYVTTNFTEDITLPHVAKKFGYNKCYLSSAFKSYFNESFTSFLTKQRLKEFIRLINTNEYSVLDAIFASGFTSEQTFYRVFKKTYKVNPKTYFKNLKTN